MSGEIELNDSYKNMIDKMAADSFINEQLDSLKEKPLGKYRKIAKELQEKNGYGTDPATIILGLCEEAGEVAKAFNCHHNKLYVRSPHGRMPDTVEHEMKDVLIYLGHLANVLNLDLDF
jgi:NTP pyrophosphatase (non-canonical NTP hydrolase)